ncbi:hypothetical protein AKJ09_09372 [Labilithrix luteola]|uniref:Uncharacterized protein n=2 Tax=Labilithrix luteola TaxID=1391654 RepID=A0A0K1QAF2_9BACT|nr:hypothetical protein AKJ09_09372 [Labilithrix luteola]
MRRLPRGLDSYPEYRCKASVYQIYADGLDLSAFPFDEVPASVSALLKSPTLPNAWLQEAHVTAVVLAVLDHRGLDDAAAIRLMDESNERLLNGRLFRSFMSLASPSILLTLASRQWGLIHRGMKFAVERGTPTRLRIDSPEHLHDELIAHATACGIRHALKMSRAKEPRVELESYSPTTATYVATWR